ncbi:MAG: response regulator [candidate division Zixibacteria bacterium]|nr:response regulator [candidate division Zixibacteria bacterium]
MYKKAHQPKLGLFNKALVVDDEKLSRDIISKALTRYLGCDIYTASNGVEALSYLRSGEYDILLLDFVMPGISGFNLIQEIRLLKNDVSMLIVTGNASDQDIKTLKEMGINRIVYKPFKISTLLEMVADALFEKNILIAAPKY